MPFNQLIFQTWDSVHFMTLSKSHTFRQNWEATKENENCHKASLKGTISDINMSLTKTAMDYWETEERQRLSRFEKKKKLLAN